MKVKCIANTGWDLSEKSIESGDIRETQFDIDIGEIYIVYSILLFRGTIEYLILRGPKVSPFWYSAELFEVVDNLLPIEWYFSFKGYNENDKNRRDLLSAIWGYEEMVFDANHCVDLTEREPEALDVFLKRKKEIDEYEELNKFRERS